MTTWALAANRSVAKLFLQGDKRSEFSLVEEIDHPSGRLHEGDLVTDDGAAVFQSTGKGQQRSSDPEVSATEHETQRFATSLAERLRSARIDGDFTRLVLVCAPSFLGELRTRLDPSTSELVVQEIDKNVAEQPNSELERTLATLMSKQ